ncbi:MAG: hypothetical protein DHS80DRAFT_32094 [Piptocephalis tieghemiana]|nr:MAG: hypothetical protein DHS80DRAFT_32094 [Piptocephalis tieghemiana]
MGFLDDPARQRSSSPSSHATRAQEQHGSSVRPSSSSSSSSITSSPQSSPATTSSSIHSSPTSSVHSTPISSPALGPVSKEEWIKPTMTRHSPKPPPPSAPALPLSSSSSSPAPTLLPWTEEEIRRRERVKGNFQRALIMDHLATTALTSKDLHAQWKDWTDAAHALLPYHIWQYANEDLERNRMKRRDLQVSARIQDGARRMSQRMSRRFGSPYSPLIPAELLKEWERKEGQVERVLVHSLLVQAEREDIRRLRRQPDLFPPVHAPSPTAPPHPPPSSSE